MWHGAAVLSFFSLLFVGFFSPVLLSGKLLAPGDAYSFYLPNFYLGVVLWEPLLWSGYPLAADPQNMVWFPLLRFFALFTESWNALTVAAYALAGSFTYGYAYSLTRSRAAGVAAGVTYSMSGYMMAQLGHSPIIHTAVWLPLLLWSLEQSRRHFFSAGWFAAATLAAACLALGHPQIFLYAISLAVAQTVVLGWPSTGVRGGAQRSAPGYSGWRYYAWCAAACALGVGIGAIQLLPTWELSRYSLRAQMSFAEFTSFSLPPAQAVMMLFPYAFGGAPGAFYGVPYFGAEAPPLGGWGPTELTGYVGLLPLALAAIGAISTFRERTTKFWLVVGALTFLLAMGDATPLARVFYQIPAYNKFRVPARLLFETAFAASALAAIGVAAVERRASSPRLTKFAAAALIGVIAIALGGFALSADRMRAMAAAHAFSRWSASPLENPALGVPLLIAVAGGAALLWWGARPAARRRQALLLLILIADLASFGWFYEWRFAAPPRELLNPPAAAEKYGGELRAENQRLLPVRGVLTPRDVGSPNISRMWGVPNASGYSSLILSRMSELLEMPPEGNVGGAWNQLASRALDVTATKYVLTPRADSPPAGSTPSPPASRPPLGLVLGSGCGGGDPTPPPSVTLMLPRRVRATHVRFVTALACAEGVPQMAEVVRFQTATADGATLTNSLRAGRDTTEWAYDCADVRPLMRHERAAIAESARVERNNQRCESHTYLATLPLDENDAATSSAARDVSSLRFSWMSAAGTIDIKTIELIDDRTGSSHFVDGSTLTMTGERWRFVETTAASDVYENLRTLPRARLVPQTLTLTAPEILRAIQTSRLPNGDAYDPRRTALVEESSAFAVENFDPRARVAINRGENYLVELATSAASDSFLVLSDADYPGWRATIDGRAARTIRADYAMRGVALPAGDHVVRFEFRPTSFYLGAATSLICVSVLIAFVWCGWRKRARVNSYSSSS